MQIVIEIDEERYSYVKNQVKNGIDNPLKVIIANGTPLPKGHGSLIDQDALIGKIHGVRSITAVLDAEVIVKADGGDTE